MTRIYTVPPLPYRPPDGHKGTFGRILVVGGSPDMLGAPVLAGTAALRSGAGLVQVAVHRSLLPFALSHTLELVGHALDDRSDKRLLAAAEQADVLAIGPGMGLTPVSLRRLLALLKLRKPTVLDADAITLLARQRELPTPRSATDAPLLITPHPGEMQRLGRHFGHTEIVTSDHARLALATAAAQALGATVILKGARTAIADGHHTYIHPVSNTALSKAGTGDVLTGISAALLALTTPPNPSSTLSPFESAILAVHLHAHAGTLAGESLGPHSTLASDLLTHLPTALQLHSESTRSPTPA